MTGLFEPGRIGPATIRNRIVMPPMTTRTADADGFVTGETLAYYAARARGGTGLVTVEMASPERAGRHRHHELGIFDDRFLPGLSRLAAAIRAEGAAASVQLGHGGGHTRRDVCGETPVAPSALPHPVFEITGRTIVPEAMSAARIEETTRAFVAAARRAREAGFDCVEIHAAHGYLISQFLTPAENVREDGYGGSLRNRARFGLEVLARIRNEVPGIGIVYRLGVEDFFAEGMPFEDGLKVARQVAEGGADAVHVTAGHYRSQPSAAIMIPPMAHPDATFLHFAARVREAVDVPVIAVGRLGDPQTATAAVRDGKADFVALGRALLADPDWPEKVRAGRPVRRCLACNTCIDGMRGGGKIRCLVNPVTGRELAFAHGAGPRGERIAVVGAGPAGLSYAGLAARDNEVTVFERAPRAGGAFILAGLAPRFQEVEAAPEPFARYITDLEADCRNRGVVFRYGADPVRAPGLLETFDRIVVATGARPRFGLGPLTRLLLASGLARRGPLRRVLERDDVRAWFYRRARRGTADAIARLARQGQTVTAIGDAATPGKGGEAIGSAFAAALMGDPAADLGPDRIPLPQGDI